MEFDEMVFKRLLQIKKLQQNNRTVHTVSPVHLLSDHEFAAF